VNANSVVRVKVEGGGEQVVAHVGLHALGAFADRLGVGDSLSRRIPVTGERLPLHDRGKVLVHAMLMLAGGGEACSDIEHLRAQDQLFGSVPSDSTLYRTLRSIDANVLAGLWEAMAEIRGGLWRRSAATSGCAPVVLDIDSSLVEVHSENKEGTGPTYKGGFGFNPMLCTADATGEVLAVRLRPGNAGTTTVTDHLEVLDAAVAGLPPEVAIGHRPGEGPRWCSDRSGCGPTRPAAATASCGGAGPATSASPWSRARTPSSARPYRGPWPTPSGGRRLFARTAALVPARPWLN
jgi:hypothetical protein